MYESFYGFTEKPFSLLPDPDFLFLGKHHSSALNLLEYGLVNQAGFTVITGHIGCGKTTLIRALLNRMEQDVTVGLISNAHESFGELLEWVLLAFDLEQQGKSKVERYRTFIDFLIAEYGRNRRTILIVDEAQNLSAATLEELRMLSNVNADKDQVLQLILVGQPELLDTLRRPDLVQFAQRVAVDYFLEPLSEVETKDYVRHRLTVAGVDPGLFRPGAFPPIYRFSKGVPRLINLICDLSLVYGFGAGRRRIAQDIVEEVVLDKVKGQRLWRKKSNPSHKDTQAAEGEVSAVGEQEGAEDS